MKCCQFLFQRYSGQSEPSATTYKYGAWYLSPKTWKKLPADEPLNDPKEEKGEQDSEVKQKEDNLVRFSNSCVQKKCENKRSENACRIDKTFVNFEHAVVQRGFFVDLLQNHELAELHGASAFMDYINKKHSRRPEFLDKVSVIQDRKAKEAQLDAEKVKQRRLDVKDRPTEAGAAH